MWIPLQETVLSLLFIRLVACAPTTLQFTPSVPTNVILWKGDFPEGTLPYQWWVFQKTISTALMDPMLEIPVWDNVHERVALSETQCNNLVPIILTNRKFPKDPVQIYQLTDPLGQKQKVEVSMTMELVNFHEHTAELLNVASKTLLIKEEFTSCPAGPTDQILIDMKSASKASCNRVPYWSSSGLARLVLEQDNMWLTLELPGTDLRIDFEKNCLYPQVAIPRCYNSKISQHLYEVNSTLWASVELKGRDLQISDLIRM